MENLSWHERDMSSRTGRQAMQTIVGISLSPVYILPLMFTFSIIGRTLLFRVRYFLSDTGHLWYKTHPAVLSGIWLYSIAVALIILSSSPLLYRIHAVLILSFILQMAVTDAWQVYYREHSPGVFNCRNAITNHDWYMVVPYNRICHCCNCLILPS